MSSARFAARAAKLSFDVLVALVGDAAAASAEARRAFDEAAARHDPLPDGLVSGVLLLPDLLSPILSSLDATHGAAACVCKLWREKWRETEEQRRRLIARTTIDVGMKVTNICADAEGGNLYLYSCYFHQGESINSLLTYDGSEVRKLCDIDYWLLYLAVANNSIYASCGHSIASTPCVRRLRLTNGEPQSRYGGIGHEVTPGPDGALFVCSEGTLLCLDALALTKRFRFGGEASDDEESYFGSLAVGNGELYACHSKDRYVHVFSLTGEPTRVIRGEFELPVLIGFAKDRLYLVEAQQSTQHRPASAGDEDRNGRRILVLTPEGKTLQIYQPEACTRAGQQDICGIEVWKGELLVQFHGKSRPEPRIEVLAGA